MEKSSMRKKLKLERDNLGQAARAIKSNQISEKLINLTDWSKIAYLHIYEPISSLAEVDIAPFVEMIKLQHPDIGVFTSRKIAEKWRITSVGGESLDQLPQFDYIIVPMLGFDMSLHRIGYGGGYYDRFLATQTKANKIGVCFDDLQTAQLPTEITDIALDMIVTEAKIYTP